MSHPCNWSATKENALSSMQLECHQRKCFPKRFPEGWSTGTSGISKQRATQLVVFSSIMNATKYGDILSSSPCAIHCREVYHHPQALSGQWSPTHQQIHPEVILRQQSVLVKEFCRKLWTKTLFNWCRNQWRCMYLWDKHKSKNLKQLTESSWAVYEVHWSSEKGDLSHS